MSDWLYPLSSTSGRTLGHGTRDAGPQSLARIVNSTGKEHWWTLATNFRKVAVGDRVWCYYGIDDDDLGVVALGIVEDTWESADRREHEMRITWDKPASSRLRGHPVPATQVRQYIRVPRSAVQNLTPHPTLVARLEKAAGI